MHRPRLCTKSIVLVGRGTAHPLNELDLEPFLAHPRSRRPRSYGQGCSWVLARGYAGFCKRTSQNTSTRHWREIALAAVHFHSVGVARPWP